MNDDVKKLSDDEKRLRRWLITGNTAKKIVDQKALVDAMRDGPRVNYQSEVHSYKRAIDDLLGSEFISLHIETKHFPLTGEVALTEVTADRSKEGGVTIRIDGEHAKQVTELIRKSLKLDREIEMLQAERHDLRITINKVASSAGSGGSLDFSFSLDPGRFDEDGTVALQEVNDAPTGGLASLLRSLAA